MQNKFIPTYSYRAGQWERSSATVIAEQAVMLTVNNVAWLTFMCTPVDMEALAVGFLFNEEIIDGIAEVASVRICPTGDNIDVWLNHAVQKPEKWARTSGCSGGKTRLARAEEQVPVMVRKNGGVLPAAKISELVHLLSNAQQLYKKSGGVHTSALSDGEKLIFIAEDIGRHNTLDKLAGRWLIERLSLPKKIILTTGRISSEMIQKAGRMGASIVISRTSPSTLSVQMAEQLGISLVGYARSDGFIVYAHPERILSEPIGARFQREVT